MHNVLNLLVRLIALFCLGILGLTGCASGTSTAANDSPSPSVSASQSSPPGEETFIPPVIQSSSEPTDESQAPTPDAAPSEGNSSKSVSGGESFSIDDPMSPWVVVNKSRPLNPINFSPPDLIFPNVPNINDQPVRQEAAAAVERLFGTAHAEAGLQLSLQSAYRSFETQKRIYDGERQDLGEAAADSITARPGHSEHQTGLVVDISAVPAQCSLQTCFADTPHGRWLAENAWRFGFILRYPQGLTHITGYEFEPWHFRYVGPALAAEMRNQQVQTLEEFFGVPGGTTYP